MNRFSIVNMTEIRKAVSRTLLPAIYLCICTSFFGAFAQQETHLVELGKNLTLKCNLTENDITWQLKNENISNKNKRLIPSVKESTSEEGVPIKEHLLIITSVKISDEGSYTCSTNTTNQTYFVQPIIAPKVISSNTAIVKQKIGQAVTLYCLFEAYPHNSSAELWQPNWLKDDMSFDFLENSASLKVLNETHFNYTLELAEVYKKENGSYACLMHRADGSVAARREMALLVMDVPQVSIDFAKAVGADKIFLNWTVNDGNDPVQKYFAKFLQEDAPTFKYYNHNIGNKNTSYVLENFQPNTTYKLRLSAKNSIGEGKDHEYHLPVRTLEQDPVFIPKVETTGSTSSTITIGWDPPSPELQEYVHYYELIVTQTGDVPQVVEETVYQQNSRNLPYMFDNLKTATEYEFKVRACSDLTRLCGPWSEIVNGTTMDGVASQPTDLLVTCVNSNISRHEVSIAWSPPSTPNGKVLSYQINMHGLTTYKLDGQLHNETWGPKMRRIDVPHHKAVYTGVNPNTNYTVTVSAITRHRKVGIPATGQCTMPISVPDTVSRIIWTKVKTSDEQVVFKVYLPKISERNGPICCYRLYLIRMGQNRNELPPPDRLNISTYNAVHSPNNTYGGAYIAEMFASDNFRSEVFLGDGKRFFEVEDKKVNDVDAVCRKCLEGKPFLRRFNAAYDVTTTAPITERTVLLPEQTQREQLDRAGNLTEAASKILDNRARRRRNPKLVVGNSVETLEDADQTKFFKLDAGIKTPPANLTVKTGEEDIFDGEIDMNSNYTGFLEIIVRDGDEVLTAYSSYFDVITPGTVAEHFDVDFSSLFNIGVPIMGILLGIILVLLIVLCFLQRYNRKHAGPGEEVISLRDSLSRALFGGRTTNHRRFIGGASNKADIGPIHKTDLCTAYKNRHKDTDYGFLREYEMLPNRFSDRTTKNSDLKENAMKNRYPDIKAYDQTRVKLSQLNTIPFSDYINANFVIGYKERKKFICAQGPMESTIGDFWRMIWEQHLEIIVMLTNLEEYNKSKCAKYWPEKISDMKQFGDISVKFVAEKKLGDYLIRNLDVSKRISDNDEEERRQITQYHYLVWKDFMAPEHPQGIIKFIRHINAVYSVQRGPILVHCSAGVGRTGTLVALDSLMQQLEEEDHVSIFNTVCDLRHQRNFLVQSLKQYIFLYRALLDTANFGNTEISAVALSSTIESLKNKPNEKDSKSKLELEFEKVLSVVDETVKTCTVGNNEENMAKNKSESVIPYDRNRVILTPIPLKENSTYINATFIEGYTTAESFIITQDPMESTISDFWRMISEQSISTLVMISEIGDGPRKCPRYWADDEIQYDHILVKYMHSESCPYYTRREFNVTNCKIDDTIKVTQFQYNGWPTVDGEVPEVCRGIIELVDQAQSHHNKEISLGCRSPLTVHCSLGTDRSSIFVAMCILVQQLRTEKSVDICSVTRKIRSQRPQLLNTYAQYEFLHRAIANYADLHKLSVESP